MTNIPRITGIDADGLAKSDADHFMECPGCGEWFDMRDLGQVFQHIHDGEIDSDEVSEPIFMGDGSIRNVYS